MRGIRMSEILFGLGVGLIFAIGALLCLSVLIGIGYILERFERK